MPMPIQLGRPTVAFRSTFWASGVDNSHLPTALPLFAARLGAGYHPVMSGAVGSGTLQEFLVNIRYVVDQSSRDNFLSGLQRATLGTKGLAVEIRPSRSYLSASGSIGTSAAP
jgi:hypothetical protein